MEIFREKGIGISRACVFHCGSLPAMKHFWKFGLFLAAWMAVLLAIWLWPPPALPEPTPVFPPPKPVSGAAVFYKQAFEAVPKLDETKRKCLVSGSAPLSNAALSARVVELYGPALALIEKGGREPACEWGVDLNKLRVVSEVNISAALSCVQALRLRARLRLEEGDAPGAADDLLGMLRLGRFAGNPPLLIGTLCRLSVEQMFLVAVMRDLTKFDEGSLYRLADGLGTLPKAYSLADAIAIERRRIPFMVFTSVRAMRDDAAREPLEDRAKEVWSNLWDPSCEDALRKASPQTIAEWTREVEAGYETLERALRLPETQGCVEIEALKAKTCSGSNPIASLVRMDITRRIETRTDAMWTVFRLALEARLHGGAGLRERLAAMADPFDGAALTFYNVEEGVQVKLRDPSSSGPVWFTVGMEPVKAPPVPAPPAAPAGSGR